MTKSPAANPFAKGQQPIDWRLWLAWVAVSALGPVLSSIAATAILKPVSPGHPFWGLISAGLLILAVGAFAAIPISQSLVLKKFVPALNRWLWFLATLGAVIVWIAIMIALEGNSEFSGRELSRSVTTSAVGRTMTAWRLLVLPWGPFLLWTMATAAATSLLPAWTLGRASGRRWATLLFLLASVAGSSVSSVVDQLYQLTSGHRPVLGPWGWALNGLSWTRRFEIWALRGGVGAVFGAVTVLLVLLFARTGTVEKRPRFPPFAANRIGGIAAMTSAPLLLAVLAPFVGYLAGPNGLVAGAPELRKALSFAPWEDRSTGELVLTYAHDIAVPVERALETVLTPDSRSAIVRSVDDSLVEVDLATGRQIRQVATGFGRYDYPSKAWSPDGRYLALRSDGAEVKTPSYTSRQNRVRLYALPDLTLAAEFPGRNGCLQVSTRGTGMLFSKDGRSLWLVCGSNDAVTTDSAIAAIRFDVPSLAIAELWRPGDVKIDGLEQIGDSIWAWQSDRPFEPFQVYDMTARKQVASINKPAALIGGMTEQTGSASVEEKMVRLKFCGTPPGSPENADRASDICRTLSFDVASGALLGQADETSGRFLPIGQGQFILAGHGLRIVSTWRADSKTGELVVSDSSTGRERQRIVSVAQRPLRMTPDGRWLLTAPRDGNRLRLYRMNP